MITADSAHQTPIYELRESKEAYILTQINISFQLRNRKASLRPPFCRYPRQGVINWNAELVITKFSE